MAKKPLVISTAVSGNHNMAGTKIQFGEHVGFIDYHDGEGSAVVNGREYRWEHHEYCGPTFLRKDGEPMKRQPGEHHPVWEAFNRWFKEYRPKRAAAKASDIIKINL
jgi:hypothetical protein